MHVLAPLIFVVFMLAIGFTVALTNRGRARSARRTRRYQYLDVALAPALALERIKAMPIGKYRADDSDAELGVVVFSSSPTLLSWGFLYPVFVSSKHNSGSLIEIGIQSRFLQVGPVVSHAHDAFVRALGIHLTTR